MSGVDESVPNDGFDLEVLFPELWTVHPLGDDQRAVAVAELVEMLAGKVEDPAAVAEASMDEFMGKIGAGSEPIMLASFRESLSDDSVLGASLIVTRNGLGGSLEPWSEAYGDNSVEVDVLGARALRIEERSAIAAGEIFDEPVHIVTWRYVVPVDASSVALFAFSTPNHELDELLLAHFDEIMQHISIVSVAG